MCKPVCMTSVHRAGHQLRTASSTDSIKEFTCDRNFGRATECTVLVGKVMIRPTRNQKEVSALPAGFIAEEENLTITRAVYPDDFNVSQPIFQTKAGRGRQQNKNADVQRVAKVRELLLRNYKHLPNTARGTKRAPKHSDFWDQTWGPIVEKEWQASICVQPGDHIVYLDASASGPDKLRAMLWRRVRKVEILRGENKLIDLKDVCRVGVQHVTLKTEYDGLNPE